MKRILLALVLISAAGFVGCRSFPSSVDEVPVDWEQSLLVRVEEGRFQFDLDLDGVPENARIRLDGAHSSYMDITRAVDGQLMGVVFTSGHIDVHPRLDGDGAVVSAYHRGIDDPIFFDSVDLYLWDPYREQLVAVPGSLRRPHSNH